MPGREFQGRVSARMIETTVFHGIFAVLTVLLMTQAAKLLFQIKGVLTLITALTFGLCFSVFIEGRHEMSGIFFMGGLYGLAAVGLYAAARTVFRLFRFRREGPFH